MTKKEREALKFTRLGYVGNISALDAEGRSLLWRAGDLRARFLLNDFSALVYVPHGSPECGATATLIHAERYLSDRLAYELAPWPKGMIKDETLAPLPDRCSHCLGPGDFYGGSDEVLVYNGGHICTAVRYKSGTWASADEGSKLTGVTHWQPLPAAPEEKKAAISGAEEFTPVTKEKRGGAELACSLPPLLPREPPWAQEKK